MTEKSTSTMTLKVTMEKPGCQSTYMNVDSLWSYLEQAVHPKNSPLTFAVHTKESSTSSSTYQELLKSLMDYTKSLKKPKMVLCLTIDILGDARIFVDANSSFSQIQNWTLASYLKTDGGYMVLVAPEKLVNTLEQLDIL